jgi:hypothetical protein
MRPLMRPLIRFAVAASAVLAAHIALAQETTQPEATQPAAAQPVEQPAVEQPSVQQPAVEQPSATQPLTMPAPSAVSAPAQTPGRGLTMAQVRDKFGTPANEMAAVGTPPISRWEYPGYVVFFESDRVLHTVLMR